MTARALGCFIGLLILVTASRGQINGAPGDVGRVFIRGHMYGYIAKTKEAGSLLGDLATIIKPRDEFDDYKPDKDAYAKCWAQIAKAGQAGTIRKILASTTVGLIGDAPGEPEISTIRIQSGPLKGTVWYTAWFCKRSMFLEGEPVTFSRSTPGAFEKMDMANFDDAVSDGNTSLYRGMVALGEVVFVPADSLAKVEGDTDDEFFTQVRVLSGRAQMKTLWISTENMEPAYSMLFREVEHEGHHGRKHAKRKHH